MPGFTAAADSEAAMFDPTGAAEGGPRAAEGGPLRHPARDKLPWPLSFWFTGKGVELTGREQEMLG